MRITTLAISVALMSLTGCASIVSGQNQSVSVETRSDNGGQVTGANCKLSNNKGTWYVTTPGSTTVNRSYEDLAVRCERANLDPGLLSVKSSTKGMAFGNILFGGIIGAGVDMSTGAAYDYPTLITVAMGSSSGLAPAPANPSGNAAPPAIGSGPSPVEVIPAPVAVQVVAATIPPGTAAAPMPTSFAPTSQTSGIVQLPRRAANPPPPAPIGQDSHQAMKIARESNCSASPAATLLAKGPGYENFTVQCANGDVQMIRCEFGNCRVLK